MICSFLIISINAYAAEEGCWPLATNHDITGEYGASYKTGSHQGSDLAVPVGTDVYASFSGTVYKAADLTTSFGKHVVVESTVNNKTIYCIYAHMSKREVNTGDKITAGQKIGETGSTGNSSGPHLHVEIRIGSYSGNTTNPRNYISQNKDPLKNVIATPTPEPLPEKYLFDPEYYASMYDDVKATYGTDERALYNHWITYGKAEGRSPSPLFDPKYYLEKNPDVKNAYGTDYSKAYDHWVTYGIYEYRKCSPIFDTAYYYNAYSDLKSTFETGRKGSFEVSKHFINYGINEGRRGSEEFDFTAYKANNKDLVSAYGNNTKEYYYHYLKHGRSENRQAVPTPTPAPKVTPTPKPTATPKPATYTVSYNANGGSGAPGSQTKTQNKNLTLSQTKPTRYGYTFQNWNTKSDGTGTRYNAGATYNANSGATLYAQWNPVSFNVATVNGIAGYLFDANYYKAKYSDLRNMNNNDLYNHWLNYGIKEGRSPSPFYDPAYYRNNNSDLKKMDNTALYNHWKNYGIKEFRNSSPIYNGAVYRKNYSDLRKAFQNQDGVAYINHFLNYGMNEGRNASDVFNVQNYRNRYSDLKNTFGGNWRYYYYHYMEYGVSEKRNGK
jgi:hypothetical protein